MHLYIIVCAAEFTPYADEALHYQLKCMQNLTAQWNMHADSCKWIYLECDENHKAHSINWTRSNVQTKWNLEWLPSTLHYLTLEHQPIGKPLCTEKLPRDLRGLTIHHGDIYGTLNLAKLPWGLELLSLADNIITGNISLLQLPKSCLAINLSSNPIRCVFVSNVMLPEKFKCFKVSDKTANVRTRFVEVNGEKCDARVRIGRSL